MFENSDHHLHAKPLMLSALKVNFWLKLLGAAQHPLAVGCETAWCYLQLCLLHTLKRESPLNCKYQRIKKALYCFLWGYEGAVLTIRQSALTALVVTAWQGDIKKSNMLRGLIQLIPNSLAYASGAAQLVWNIHSVSWKERCFSNRGIRCVWGV